MSDYTTAGQDVVSPQVLAGQWVSDSPHGLDFADDIVRLGAPVSPPDAHLSLAAAASRRVGLAERELRRWERVYEAIKGGRMETLSVADVRELVGL